RSVYAAVLKKGDKSPTEPESDEEKIEEKKPEEKKDAADKPKDGAKSDEAKKEEENKVVIDLDGIGQRIVALPIKPANYIGLDAGKTGVLFLSEFPDVPRFDPVVPAN